MAVFDPMAFAPVRVSKQWPVEGGRLNEARGLDVKDIDSKDGTVSFVKIDKNADWLLKRCMAELPRALCGGRPFSVPSK